MLDIFYKVRHCKWKFVLCVLVTVIGFGLGIGLFCASNYGWWYYNRCSFASKLIEPNFNVLFSFILTTALFYLLFVSCKMLRQTHYLCYLVTLFAGFYCGATLAALFVYSVLWGVLYAVLIEIPWIITICFACFVCVCEPAICRNFRESIRDLKSLTIVLLVGLVYKIFVLFVILKIITALI